jgi:signal transduction histidine kinase
MLARSGPIFNLESKFALRQRSAVQSHLFQPFYSTKGDLGNGLGLYIAKEIAERHQGRLMIESRLGGGTTVRLRLPAPSQDIAILA